MPDETTRWTVSVSKETDITVRTFLAQRGMKNGDLRSKFADLPPDELEALIDEAVSAARAPNPE
jgi:hypothetical protein